MTRKLASVQKIRSIAPVPNSDNLDVATVLGWKCVVNKSENFKVGDLVVYFEVDSILPECEEFEFLRSRKFRIKTIKLRGQVSQGLVSSVSILGTNSHFNEDDDVTEFLGVKKYDPQLEQESSIGDTTKFPSFIHKTDEDRIQLFPDICLDEQDTIFSVTEKLDGQSATYFLKAKDSIYNTVLGAFFGYDYEFGVCSRNRRIIIEDDSNYWKIARKFDMEKSMKTLIKKLIGKKTKLLVFQGEIIGTGIQKNKYKLDGLDFYVYNVLIDEEKIPNKSLGWGLEFIGLKTVPLLGTILLPPTIDECVELAKGHSVLNSTSLREGLVLRNNEKDISFKIINPEFLLKNDE